MIKISIEEYLVEDDFGMGVECVKTIKFLGIPIYTYTSYTTNSMVISNFIELESYKNTKIGFKNENKS